MVRVLVVDDERQLANNIADYLRSFEGDYDVAVATDGSEALRYLDDPMNHPDVLLTDIRMPGMSGLELVAAMLKIQPELGVLVMTAYGSVENKDAAARAGALRFLGKPLDLESLRMEIDAVARIAAEGSRYVGGLTIMEVTEFLHQDGATGVLQIRAGERRGLLVVVDGSVVAASTDTLEGEDAFHEMVLWGEISFAEVPGANPAEHRTNVSLPVGELLERARAFALSLEGSGSSPSSGHPSGGDPGVLGGSLDSINPVENHTKEVHTMATLKEILQGLASQLPGTQGAVVVGADGLALAEYAATPSFQGDAVAAQLVMLSKLAERSSSQLGAGKAEDTQVTTDQNYILVRPLGDSSFALCVVVDRSEGTLGMVRLVTGQVVGPLLEALPKRGK